MKTRTIIIGSGAIGLAIAWDLSRRGDQLTLLERNHTVGSGTSCSASGILPAANMETATDPLDQLRGLSHRLFPEWVAELQSVTAVDSGYRRCGGWYLADTPGEHASMVGMTQYWNELSIQCESVSHEELARREPALTPHAGRAMTAWFAPDECQVCPPDYLRALHLACQAGGVDTITDAVVDDVRWGSQSAAVQVRGRWLECDRVVVCCGAWSGSVAARLRLQSSVVPVRGQILLLKTETPLLKSVVNVGHRYLMCREDGHTLVGSCEEEVGFRDGTTDAMLSSLADFAVGLVPGLANATRAGGWSGLRPMTFDGFPMIGRLPDSENVFVAAGHFRSGIHLSPATAVVLADSINGDTPIVDIESFSVGKQQSANPVPTADLHA
jgi:glycine oxidase